MACFCYYCFKCGKLRAVEHKDEEHPVVRCTCGLLMERANNDRNKKIKQKSNNTGVRN